MKAYFATRREELARDYNSGPKRFKHGRVPTRPSPVTASRVGSIRGSWKSLSLIPEFLAHSRITHVPQGDVLQPLAKGDATAHQWQCRLYGSTKNYIKGRRISGHNQGRRRGRNVWFGIREHGMGAILNGISYDGLFRASGATFAVADYLRPSISTRSTLNLPTIYIFTHDSIGVGRRRSSS
ncbi:MAG: hypothetical protein R3C01_07385 [Planctomycetaceae bacterium]